MAQDNARKWTDKELNLLEKKIESVYREAYGDMTKKWNKYLTNAGNRVASLQNEYDKALKSGDNDLIKEAKKKLDDAKKNVTFRNKQYQDMLNDTTTRMAKANEIALSYINNKVPAIYTANYNEIQNNLDKTKIDFTLTNENVVKRLVKNGDIQLPKKKLDIPKDKQWNTKQLNSSILQGIIQGESMNKIAKRIRPIVDNNANAAIRNARTMVTGAENSGRLDSYDDLQEEGLILKKVWIATGDERTREWHLTMDGQEVNIDEPFIDGNGNEIMYPGDPSAPPETVYNCRCSMRTHIVGIKTSSGRIKKLDYEQDFSEHEKQIAQEENRREEKVKLKEENIKYTHHTVNGKDITSTFERRINDFDFAINDIINKQGYDGLPKLVSPNEFDKIAKENKFIAQRTYTADNQKILDDYRNELYNGGFYVDCKGGAVYGNGMYCASDYTGTMSQGLRDEMAHYIKASNFNRESATEEEKYEIINRYLENNIDKDKQEYALEYVKVQTEIGDINYDIVDKINDKLSESEINVLDDLSNIVNNSYHKTRSYIETFTLDNTAKIIDFDDVTKKYYEYKENKTNDFIWNEVDKVLSDNGISNNKDIKTFIGFANGYGDIDYTDAKNARDNLIKDGVYDKLTNLKEDIYKAGYNGKEYARKYLDEVNYKNEGVFATALGYDAIRVNGRGASGSYTVILNRTKVIIRNG